MKRRKWPESVKLSVNYSDFPFLISQLCYIYYIDQGIFKKQVDFVLKSELAFGIFSFWEGDHFVIEINTLGCTK